MASTKSRSLSRQPLILLEDQDVVEKAKDLIKAAKDAVAPKTNYPTTATESTGSRDDVMRQIAEDVPNDRIATCKERCSEEPRSAVWYVWDDELDVTPSRHKDFEGTVNLQWKCDCCYIYSVKAWLDAKFNSSGYKSNLRIDTKTELPQARRTDGSCVPCKPASMRVWLHAEIYESATLPANDSLRKTFSMQAILPAPCGDLMDVMTVADYKRQTSAGDWDNALGKATSHSHWGIERTH